MGHSPIIGSTCAFDSKTCPEPGRRVPLNPYAETTKNFFKIRDFCFQVAAEMIDFRSLDPSATSAPLSINALRAKGSGQVRIIDYCGDGGQVTYYVLWAVVVGLWLVAGVGNLPFQTADFKF